MGVLTQPCGKSGVFLVAAWLALCLVTKRVRNAGSSGLVPRQSRSPIFSEMPVSLGEQGLEVVFEVFGQLWHLGLGRDGEPDLEVAEQVFDIGLPECSGSLDQALTALLDLGAR